MTRELDAAFFETMVETVGVGVAIYGADGRFLYVNEAYPGMFGVDRDALVGAAVWEVNPEFEADRFTDYWDSFEPGETRTDETVHRVDGRSVPVQTVTTRQQIDGEPYNFGTVRDITARRRREEELRRQNERLDSFVGVVSHDLRNPLNVAQGYLDLLKEDVDADELELIESALDRMGTLIDDLLALARGGATVDELEPVALADVARDAWETVDTGEATLVVADGLGEVPADPTRLQQLFENVFRNAVEHGGDDVTVTVGPLEDPDGEASPPGFRVDDDGDGIDPEIRDRLFEPGASTTEDGTGFGMVIVREIAEAHDWTVEATASPSGGARFVFRPDDDWEE